LEIRLALKNWVEVEHMSLQDDPKEMGGAQSDYGQNVVGVFIDKSNTECAIDHLLDAGYARDRITMVMREPADATKWMEGYGVKTSKVGASAAGLGIPEEEAWHYENDVRQGHIMVAVECEGSCDLAYSTFRECGATNFDSSTSTSAGYGNIGRTWGGTMPTGETYPVKRNRRTVPPPPEEGC
jgi:hypothetical protein